MIINTFYIVKLIKVCKNKWPKNIFLNQTLIICNKISNPYSNENIHFLVYNENLFQKIRKFLEQKKKSQNFKPDNFFKKIKNNINSHKVKANTYVGILEAQSIGEPVTQLVLS